jgi:hypothetical protein
LKAVEERTIADDAQSRRLLKPVTRAEILSLIADLGKIVGKARVRAILLVLGAQ